MTNQSSVSPSSFRISLFLARQPSTKWWSRRRLTSTLIHSRACWLEE